MAGAGETVEPLSEQQVLAFLHRFDAAQNSEDFDSVAPMLHPDVLFRFNDGDYRGIESARGAFESTWAHDVEDEVYRLSDIEVLHAGNNWATATYRFHWSGVAAGGPFEVGGRGTAVIVLHQGKLKLLVEHLSR